MSFPNLPPLDDLDNSDINSDVEENLYEVLEKEAGLGLPGLPIIDDNLDFEDSDFEDINYNNESDLNDFIIEDNDDEEIDYDENEDGDFEDIDEGDLEGDFGFLPNVIEDYENESEISINKTSKIKSSSEVDKGPRKNEAGKHKELDDEAIKQFFINIRNKVFKKSGIIPKNKKEPKKRDTSKENDIKKESKPKNNKGKDLGKRKQLAIIIAILLIVAIAGFLLLNKLSPGNKELTKLFYEIKGEETIVLLNDFEVSETDIKVSLENQGDLLIRFFMDIELSTKTSLFKKSKFICQSDIIFLDVGEEVQETLKCMDLLESDKYSINVNFTEIK